MCLNVTCLHGFGLVSTPPGPQEVSLLGAIEQEQHRKKVYIKENQNPSLLHPLTLDRISLAIPLLLGFDKNSDSEK